MYKAVFTITYLIPIVEIPRITIACIVHRVMGSEGVWHTRSASIFPSLAKITFVIAPLANTYTYINGSWYAMTFREILLGSQITISTC